MLVEIALIVIVAAGLVVLLHPKVQHNVHWRAVVTPLASIIGSGFLVAGPVLSYAAGQLAVVAMLGLCLVAYFYGSAIRTTIRYSEAEIEAGTAPRHLLVTDRLSDAVLTFAYFISVAYYINLFASFGLKGIGIVDPNATRWVAVVVIGAIGAVGLWRGLGGLERVEVYAVGLKLAIIASICVVLLGIQTGEIATGTFSWPQISHDTGWNEFRVLLGLVILVQGFETSRYLGEAYDGPLRIRTMRYAQWLSTAIYLIFVLLATRYFTGQLPAVGGETEIIELLRPVSLLIAPLIIITALASQLSAAVADMNGAGGLVAEESGKRLSVAAGYAVTAGAAIIVTLFANIFEIITLASKAFVAYYGLQSLQAVWTLMRAKPPHWQLKAAFYSLGIPLAIVIVLFAIPVE
ncbi:MAG: hypothetical protein KDJ19_05940 [Hyphomicrobiaceae bacterium]|nr:hypothetical protein [Hyphomicrobiaceae bacterium]MCC0024737.1 hypothetical protein [Hyphomicrobiaceae bacterium]